MYAALSRPTLHVSSKYRLRAQPFAVYADGMKTIFPMTEPGEDCHLVIKPCANGYIVQRTIDATSGLAISGKENVFNSLGDLFAYIQDIYGDAE